MSILMVQHLFHGTWCISYWWSALNFFDRFDRIGCRLSYDYADLFEIWNVARKHKTINEQTKKRSIKSVERLGGVFKLNWHRRDHDRQWCSFFFICSFFFHFVTCVVVVCLICHSIQTINSLCFAFYYYKNPSRMRSIVYTATFAKTILASSRLFFDKWSAKFVCH